MLFNIYTLYIGIKGIFIFYVCAVAVAVENCSTNQRNRGSEEIMNQFISNFHHHQQPRQSHCNQFMDVSQIQSRNIDVSTGLKLAFNDQQQHHHHQQQQQSSGLVTLLSQDLSSLINQQGDEIQHYLQSQVIPMNKFFYLFHGISISGKKKFRVSFTTDFNFLQKIYNLFHGFSISWPKNSIFFMGFQFLDKVVAKILYFVMLIFW